LRIPLKSALLPLLRILLKSALLPLLRILLKPALLLHLQILQQPARPGRAVVTASCLTRSRAWGRPALRPGPARPVAGRPLLPRGR
jgi:hypothetical protein